MIEPPEIVQTTEQLNARIRLKVPRDQIQHVMGSGIAEVMGVLASQGIEPAGPLYTHHLRRPTANFDFEICVPVNTPIQASGRVRAGVWPAMKVARTVYHGPYDGLGEAWAKFLDWIEAQGLEQADELWERYTVGPDSGWDPSMWRTELSRPLAH